MPNDLDIIVQLEQQIGKPLPRLEKIGFNEDEAHRLCAGRTRGGKRIISLRRENFGYHKLTGSEQLADPRFVLESIDKIVDT